MADNAKTINDIKNKVTNIANTTTKQILNVMDVDRDKLIKFMKNNYKKVLLLSFVVFIIIFYFIAIFRRVPRFLDRMKVYKMNIQPLQYNKQVMQGDFRLCDFYVASSYKSYLPCTNYYDYACLSSIEKVLLYGARYIDLDVFNKSFNPCTEPIVCNGDEIGNWQYTTSIHFTDVCELISKVAFSSQVKNPTDPLFININFKTWGNKLTINKCAHIIKKFFLHKLLSKDFSYQGRYTSYNLATTPIKDLLEKVIIISTGNISGTDMDEITNLHPKKNSNLRDQTFLDIRDSYDIKEIKEYNKRNLTRVIPYFNTRMKQNYNYFTSYAVGCQFICMNYTEPTEFMKSYAHKFSECSFRLKPYKLRYKPIYIPPPLKQTKKVSFAPKKKTTPFYSITY